MASYDVLRDVLDNEVAAYRNQDYATSLMAQVAVHRVPDATQLTFGHPRRIGYSSYYFTAYGSTSKKIEITCSKTRKPIISDGTRGRIHAYLDDVERACNPLDDLDSPQDIRQLRAATAQQQWWANNGQVFRFFDLPSELRGAIYAAAMPSIMHLYPFHPCRRLTGRYANALVPRSMGLVVVSRTVNAEATDWFFRNTTFLIEHIAIWSKLIRDSYLVHNIRRLEIDLSLTDFMSFFFGDHLLTPMKDLQRCVSRRKLRRMALTHIDIRLPDQRQLMESSRGCLTELTTFLLHAVWQHIHGHMRVTVLNITDAEQGLAFMNACKEARLAYKLWRSNAEAVGYNRLTLTDYDVWCRDCAADEDGGVSLVDVEEDKDHGWMKRCPQGVRCICTTLCR